MDALVAARKVLAIGTDAQELARELRRLLSVQAPNPPGRAVPFAPPRRVTGKLLESTKVHPTAHGARVVVYAPYSVPLEKSKKWYGWPHAFLSVALRNLGLAGRHSG